MTTKFPIKWGPRKAHLTIVKAVGFTLIELMVVVAIIGILAAIAYPNYQCYVSRSNRNAAVQTLVEATQFMERWNTINNTYAGAVLPAALTVAPRDNPRPTWIISLDPVRAGPNSYRVIASINPLNPPRGGTCVTACPNMDIDEQQVKRVNGSTAVNAVSACFTR